MWFIVLCTYAITLWYGSQQIADTMQYGYTDFPRSQSGGKVYAAFFASLIGAFALGRIATPLGAVTSARVAAKQFLKVINRKPLIDGLSEEGEKSNDRPKGLVELKDVIFAYPSRPDIQVCKGYSLAIVPGQSCALVGASGSGKSTIVNLLLRFYDPQSGLVLLDGQDIKNLNVRWLRSKIGYVGQEPVLFSGTIAENISYGLDASFAPELAIVEASEKHTTEQVTAAKNILRGRILDAARQANAHEFIVSLPNGYDTDVGSSGSSLSGGQKQRIAIARALIKKPVVLLLDEATSALDATSERIVQDSIDKLQQSKLQTTIIIAHRLNTIKNADKIAVVSEGVVAEEGTHDQLMAVNGLYADLVRLQVEGQSDAPKTKSVDSDEQKAANESDNNFSQSTIVDSNGEPVAASKKVVKEESPALTKAAQKEKSELLKKVWAMIYQQLNYFIVAVIGSVMVGALFPLWGFILGKSLGVLFESNASDLRRNAVFQAIYFVALAVDAGIGGVLQKYGVAQVGEKIVMQLRSEQFQAILRRDIAFFDAKENTVGEITTRLANDARSVTKATGEAAAAQIQAIACLIIGIIFGFISCWKIGLVVIGAMVPLVLSGGVKMAAYSGQLDSLIFGSAHDEDAETRVISTAFTQMRTVTAFSVQYKIAKLYSALTLVKTERLKKKAWITGLAKGMAEFITNSVFSILFYYAGVLLSNNEFAFGDIMQSILALMLASFGLGQSLADLGDLKEALLAADRIFRIIEDGKMSAIDGLSSEGQTPTSRSLGRIELSHVSFCYPTRPEAKVCRDYCLVIEPGEVVALVGPSGSGKSTIMNLLLRFYDPDSGVVKLDGINVKELNVRWLRSQIGYVGQEPVLFKGTIADNIGRGRAEYAENVLPLSGTNNTGDDNDVSYFRRRRSSASTHSKYAPVVPSTDEEMGLTAVPEDIVAAAKASAAHDFITGFSKGYNTDVGESSMMVSGGQKQRIAIARALIKKPAVLLLDEATSALDAASERFVQDSIDALQQSKAQTIIVIAHRLTTIRNADKIAVINEGKVVEIGKHDELLSLNGLYAELWRKQVGGGSSKPVKLDIENLE